jgi:hypothetical protein
LGVGPQVVFIFPVGGMQGYLNFKGYGEFDGSDRPTGWNAWATVVISPAAPAAAAPARPDGHEVGSANGDARSASNLARADDRTVDPACSRP